jgi:hypothetical protein
MAGVKPNFAAAVPAAPAARKARRSSLRDMIGPPGGRDFARSQLQRLLRNPSSVNVDDDVKTTAPL